jgi:hypothetical protein
VNTKWSDFDAATLPLTGDEIVALAIAGTDNVQLFFSDFLEQIFNPPINLTNVEIIAGSFAFEDLSGNLIETYTGGILLGAEGTLSVIIEDNLNLILSSIYVNSFLTFNGTLADAIAANKSVECGLIIN